MITHYRHELTNGDNIYTNKGLLGNYYANHKKAAKASAVTYLVTAILAAAALIVLAATHKFSLVATLLKTKEGMGGAIALGSVLFLTAGKFLYDLRRTQKERSTILNSGHTGFDVMNSLDSVLESHSLDTEYTL